MTVRDFLNQARQAASQQIAEDFAMVGNMLGFLG
jgi:hypothetical protein